MTTSRSFWVRRAVGVAWLVAVWGLLWGGVDLLVVSSGAVVGMAAMAASRLPPRPLSTRVRWRRLPGAVLRFLGDLFRSSWAVTVTTVRRGPGATSSVLALRLPPGTSDGALLLACDRISLEPGTIVLEVERQYDRIYVYQLGTEDRSAAERVRGDIQHLLDTTLATFPSVSDQRESAEDRPTSGGDR